MGLRADGLLEADLAHPFADRHQHRVDDRQAADHQRQQRGPRGDGREDQGAGLEGADDLAGERRLDAGDLLADPAGDRVQGVHAAALGRVDGEALGERGRVDVKDPGVIAVVGDHGILPRRRNRHPVDAAPARQAAIGQVARRADLVPLHIHHEHLGRIGERCEPAVERRVSLPGAEVVHAERQRPASRLRARHHVEPHQLTAVHVDPLVRMHRARVPTVVARAVVRTLPADGLIGVPIEKDHARRAVVLQRQETSVRTPGLILGVVMPHVGPPSTRAPGREGKRRAVVPCDPRDRRAEGLGRHRRQVAGFRRHGLAEDRGRIGHESAAPSARHRDCGGAALSFARRGDCG